MDMIALGKIGFNVSLVEEILNDPVSAISDQVDNPFF